MAKIVFFGTPDYVIPILLALKTAEHKIVAVVTQPPKPAGRKQIPTPSLIAQWAEKEDIQVFTNTTLLHSGVVSSDVGVLVAYGKIIPREIIDLFPNGILNIHPSLLPKHRGASPVQATIASGERQTGVSIIRLDEKVDHGPIVAQFSEDIRLDDTTSSLRVRLFTKAAEVLVEILPHYVERRITSREQDHSRATYTTLVKKEHGFIPPEFIAAALEGGPVKKTWSIPFIKDYSLSPNSYAIERFIRAMQPWPIAWTLLRQGFGGQARRLKILKAHVEDGKLVPDQVQLEGKNPVSWKQFRQGYPTTKF